MGRLRGNNPWQATGLEWQIQSPPLTENFTEIPIVDHEAYDYEWLESTRPEQEVTYRWIADRNHGSDRGDGARAEHEHPSFCRSTVTTSRRRSSSGRRQLWDVAVPADGDHVLRRDVLRVSALSQLVLPGVRGGSHSLHLWAGTLNTTLLIISSFTMAMAVHASENADAQRRWWAGALRRSFWAAAFCA
jgi:hypothetical protein